MSLTIPYSSFYSIKLKIFFDYNELKNNLHLDIEKSQKKTDVESLKFFQQMALNNFFDSTNSSTKQQFRPKDNSSNEEILEYLNYNNLLSELDNFSFLLDKNFKNVPVYSEYLCDFIKKLIKKTQDLNLEYQSFIINMYSFFKSNKPHEKMCIDFLSNYIKEDLFFINNKAHTILNLKTDIPLSMYNSAYLLAFHNDLKLLEKVLPKTHFNPSEEHVLLNKCSDPYDVLNKTHKSNILSIILNNDYMNSEDFLLPSKNLMLMIHFSFPNKLLAPKNMKEVEDIRSFYEKQGVFISENQEALLLDNSLYYKNSYLFKNWNWNAKDNFAIKKAFLTNKEVILNDINKNKIKKFINSLTKEIFEEMLIKTNDFFTNQFVKNNTNSDVIFNEIKNTLSILSMIKEQNIDLFSQSQDVTTNFLHNMLKQAPNIKEKTLQLEKDILNTIIVDNGKKIAPKKRF